MEEKKPTKVRKLQDYSLLPEVVLVKVFQHLCLEDRYRASLSCKKLYSIFYHPSVWKVAKLNILATLSLYNDCEPIIPKPYYMLLAKFGKYIQELTLKVTGFPRNFPKQWNDALYTLAKTNQLARLDLDIGSVTSIYHLSGKRPSDSDISPILSLISGSTRLKICNIWSWPMMPAIFNNKELNVLSALMKNPKFRDVNHLTLFGPIDQEWTERSPLLPSAKFTVRVIQHLGNLTHLSLRSPMFDRRVITELSSARKVSLKYLHIYINYSRHEIDLRTPEILSRRWIKLCISNPEVEVEVTILNKIPNQELFKLLKPETPIAAINFRKYSSCNSELFMFIANNYGDTLHRFVLQCRTITTHDKELVYLVENSKSLDVLQHHGSLQSKTIDHVKSSGNRWRKLDFNKI